MSDYLEPKGALVVESIEPHSIERPSTLHPSDDDNDSGKPMKAVADYDEEEKRTAASELTATSDQQQPPSRQKGMLQGIRKHINVKTVPEYILLAVAGAALGIQAGANGRMAGITDGYFASFMCMGIGLVALSITVVIEYFFYKKTTLSQFKETQWWQWTGAIWGVLFVTLNTLSLATLGPAGVLGIVVGAQLVTACIIDHFGLFGMVKRRLTLLRIAGVVILIASIVVMALW